MSDPLDPPAFDPVPVRARHDGWTAERQRAFIAELRARGTVRAAARAVGMSGKSAYKLRERAGNDSGFARAWEAALDNAYRDALDYALPLALEGEEVSVFYRGKVVGRYRRHDTRLALAILRARAARDGMADRREDW